MSAWPEFSVTPTGEVEGVPSFVDPLPEPLYSDPPGLDEYLRRYRLHLAQESVYDTLLLRTLRHGDAVISIGEGTGEFVASLATRHPSIRFIAFDYHPSRILIARRLVDALGLDNVRLYVGSAALIPFPLKIFQGAIERGVFHVLPHELKVGNLSEIERVCAGRVIMTHMVNTTRYLLVRLIQSIRHRRSVIWTDAYKTFRMIEPGLDSLRRLANFVQQRTGHEVSILHNFHGDVELSCQSPRNPSLEYLGGLTYVVPA